MAPTSHRRPGGSSSDQSLRLDCICLGAVHSSNHQVIKMRVPREARNPNAMATGKEVRSQGLGGQWSLALSSSQTFGQMPCSHGIWGKSPSPEPPEAWPWLSSLGMVTQETHGMGTPVPSPLQSPKDWSPWCQQPWASVGVVPGGSEEWMASPGQKYLLGLESTAVRPIYKKPCALKMMFSSFSVWTDFKRFCGPSQDHRLGIVTLMESHFPLSGLVSPRLTASKSSPQHTWGYSEAFYTSQVW